MVTLACIVLAACALGVYAVASAASSPGAAPQSHSPRVSASAEETDKGAVNRLHAALASRGAYKVGDWHVKVPWGDGTAWLFSIGYGRWSWTRMRVSDGLTLAHRMRVDPYRMMGLTNQEHRCATTAATRDGTR